jgi:hypothetical protein
MVDYSSGSSTTHRAGTMPSPGTAAEAAEQGPWRSAALDLDLDLMLDLSARRGLWHDSVMTNSTWAEFSAAAPRLAAEGRRLIYRGGDGAALLASVRGDELPRIHPINVGIVDDGLFAFIIGRSAKRVDLATDGRFALHAHVDPDEPSEFMIRGRAALVTGAVRADVAAHWFFDVDQSYDLFELSIESAVLGERSNPDEWPPRYTTWKAER